MTIKELKNKWRQNTEFYQQQEVGSGVHSFVKDVFLSSNFFDLEEITKKTNKFATFVHEAEKKKEGQPDFVLFISEEVSIPVEVKRYGNINEGVKQLLRYQLDYSKQFGILTDGYEWRFYRSSTYRKFTIDDFFEKLSEFLLFWKDYVKSENYYLEIFNPAEKSLFAEKLDLNDPENRKVFFEDITHLIENFKTKMQTLGIWGNAKNVEENKIAVETAYTFLIQFILFKTIVDTGLKNYIQWYKKLHEIIKKYLLEHDNYQSILLHIKGIADFISSHIYKPFKEEQEAINNKIFTNFKNEYTIDDISAWLDILLFIDKYRFDNLRNEIFGFIYENYLKDLYGDKNKGQYFTAPEVVNLMLEEIGYTSDELENAYSQLSIIDPSCGAGTFLYSAVDKIIETYNKKNTEKDAKVITELVKNNIFGLDIEEFPLYLAEMSILMRLLPLIINDNYENSISEKIKVFKTKDSISEFLDAGLVEKQAEIDYPQLFSLTDLGYPSFMRDNKNLQEMIESMQGANGKRMRFDFVVGNPPYVGLNECYKNNIPFAVYMREKNPDGTQNENKKLYMNNVYGVNLHSIPNKAKKGRPNPNLYSFFIALGLALLKKEGKLCYIIPQTLLTANDYDVIRYHLAKNTTIEKLLTFEDNLFIDRGLKENKPVATSSLIFIVSKKLPEENHKVTIVNYDYYFKKKGESFKDYFSGKNKRKRKEILQKELLQNVENWNFITQNNNDIKFIADYIKKTDDFSVYYTHSVSISKFQSNFYFDGGYSIDEQKILTEKSDYIYPKTNNKYFSIKEIKGYWKNERQGKSPHQIGLRQGNQAYNLLDARYKILWTHTNAKRFFFTDKPVIWARNQFNAIGGNNHHEMFYLFALLNSSINFSVLRKNLKSENEKNFTLALKSVKQYIRIPKITTENQPIKAKIIELTEKMLDLENTTDNSLIFNRQEITLQELRNLEAINFEDQEQLKKHIDNLVFALYFEIEIPKNKLDNFEFVQEECEKCDF